MAKPAIHICYNKDEKKWSLVREKAKKPIKKFEKKENAQKEGIKIAKKDNVELVIHNKQNVIIDKDSYGNDPFPPRDRVF